MEISLPQFEKVENNPAPEWALDDGRIISLLTLDELREIQTDNPHSRLISIFGSEHYAADCNEDIRYGYVAYGKLKNGA